MSEQAVGTSHLSPQRGAVTKCEGRCFAYILSGQFKKTVVYTRKIETQAD